MHTSAVTWVKNKLARDTMSAPKSGQFLDKESTDSIELVTIAKAAKLLAVSASTMRRLQQERRIPFFKIGRCVRFARHDLAKYLAKGKIESVG